MKKVFIYSSGCHRRTLDAKKILNYFKKNNYLITNDVNKADLIVFITCAAIDSITDFSFEKIKEFSNYDAELIVAGCIPTVEKNNLSKIFKGKTISTKNIDDFDLFFPENTYKFSDTLDTNISHKNENFRLFLRLKKIFNDFYFLMNAMNFFKKIYLKIVYGNNSLAYSYFLNNSPFYVRVSWGCYGNCSYCGIKRAIGKYKSKSLDSCIAEIKNGLKSGVDEFVLTADDIGGYGLDIDSSFPELLNKIDVLDGDFKIVIHGLNPVWLVKYIDDIENIVKNGRVKMILSPIQSGSIRVLREMHRFSDLEKIKDAFLRLKSSSRDLLLYTHLILGFPSETEEEFKETLEFVNDVGFDSGFVYLFSLKTGTKAEKIDGKLSSKDFLNRVNLLENFLSNLGYDVVNVKKKGFLIFDKKQVYF